MGEVERKPQTARENQNSKMVPHEYQHSIVGGTACILRRKRNGLRSGGLPPTSLKHMCRCLLRARKVEGCAQEDCFNSAAGVERRLHSLQASSDRSRELDIPASSIVYWTDSMAVIRFINNRETRFKVFVANRLAVIHEHSKPSQWSYINTKENPADVASRGAAPDDEKLLLFWLHGPSFLHEAEINR